MWEKVDRAAYRAPVGAKKATRIFQRAECKENAEKVEKFRT